MEGWFVLHDFRSIDRQAWTELASSEREKIIEEAADLLASFEEVTDADEGHSVTYRMLGHKADLLVMHLRPTVGELESLERRLDQSLLGPFTRRPYSYLSVVELSRHGAPEGATENLADSPYVKARLYPDIPEHDSHICFYPMGKKRDPQANWFLLDPEERGRLMRSHGRIGRRYAGSITQIVTGSMGIDDWEWGVTLFADDPLQFKKVVYEMRYDEVSARYAEFGPFFVGVRMRPEELGDWLGR